MKAAFKKLKNKAGETLVETLCAILVFTMASIVMFTMVTTAADINMTAKEMDKANQKHLIDVEKGDSSAKNGTANINFSMVSGGNTVDIASAKVDIYGGKNDSLFTYFIIPPTEPAQGGS